MSNKIVSTTLSFEVPIWIYFAKEHLNFEDGTLFEGFNLNFFA
jgi:hypothetical protein